MTANDPRSVDEVLKHLQDVNDSQAIGGLSASVCDRTIDAVSAPRSARR